jgi:hypothetical protein
MSIIVSKGDNNAKKINESYFGLESKLQEYVKNNPDIIPIYEINEEARLFVLAREFPTNSGPIDALGTDQDGNIYVIETKLYKNQDKRTVLAQALDYGASLWRHSGDSTQFVSMLNQKVKDQFGVDLVEKLQEFFEIEEGQLIVDNMAKNVLNGNIKFVILMDSVEDRLKDLITYVNQNSRFDIYAVDLEYYEHDEFEIIIPKLYGSEVKKEVSSLKEGDRFDISKINSWINELELEYLHVDSSRTTKTYLRFTTDTIDKILPPRDDTASNWKNGNAYYYEIAAYQSGAVKLGLVLNSTAANEVQADGQRKLINISGRTPRSQDWVWFTVASWKLEYQNGDQALKDAFTRILTKDIPEFERSLIKQI